MFRKELSVIVHGIVVTGLFLPKLVSVDVSDFESECVCMRAREPFDDFKIELNKGKRKADVAQFGSM